MAEPTARTLESQLRAVDAWWREAGVDYAFTDAPNGWLAEPEEQADGLEEAFPAPPVPAVEPEPPPELLAGGPASWPASLEEFDRWWIDEPALALGRGPRVPPRGPANAPLMVLVAQPEADDAESLLSGPQGRLLANALAAFGFGPGECRISALIPAHLPHPDWPALDRAGWGALARHHLALAAPRRLLVLGQVALPLLGHDTAQGPAAFHEVALEGGSVPALAARSLETLLLRPRLKAGLWRRWLEWTDGNA